MPNKRGCGEPVFLRTAALQPPTRDPILVPNSYMVGRVTKKGLGLLLGVSKPSPLTVKNRCSRCGFHVAIPRRRIPKIHGGYKTHQAECAGRGAGTSASAMGSEMSDWCPTPNARRMPIGRNNRPQRSPRVASAALAIICEHPPWTGKQPARRQPGRNYKPPPPQAHRRMPASGRLSRKLFVIAWNTSCTTSNSRSSA